MQNVLGLFAAGGLGGYFTLFKKETKEAEEAMQGQLQVRT